MRKLTMMLVMSLTVVIMSGCAGPQIKLFTDASDPLQEMTLEGTGKDKVLLISVDGVITDTSKSKFMRKMPSVVQEVVSHLRLAEKDDRVKAVLLKIDSPGGNTTASDILYHEISAFKARTGKKVVVSMMNLATSGAYYISLPADVIMAHPTSVTGSVGVILMRPEMSGLMQKIGVAMQVNKSGENKDMGSPFRSATTEEDLMLQDLTDTLGQRFVGLVKKHRTLNDAYVDAIADARIFIADDALKAGLVDRVGYLPDAVDAAKKIAELDEDARLVTYRRTEYPDDNIYNALSSAANSDPALLLNFGPISDLLSLDVGFYYIWPQAFRAP